MARIFRGFYTPKPTSNKKDEDPKEAKMPPKNKESSATVKSKSGGE